MLYVRHVGNNGHPCKFSGTSGEGQESARNLPFPGVIWMTAMPHLRTFVTPHITGSRKMSEVRAALFAVRVHVSWHVQSSDKPVVMEND